MATPELTAVQRRVLGVLLEKSLATPQAYPLTEAATIAACNQRSNRDPVTDLDQSAVRRALLDLRQLGIARLIQRHGDRVEKHAHRVDDVLELAEPAQAILALLLVRGPQTVGELRTRSERLHRFATPDDVQTVLDALADRAEPLVRVVERQRGQKGARWAHLLADQAEVEAQAAAEADELETLRAEVVALRAEVARLRALAGEPDGIARSPSVAWAPDSGGCGPPRC